MYVPAGVSFSDLNVADEEWPKMQKERPRNRRRAISFEDPMSYTKPPLDYVGGREATRELENARAIEINQRIMKAKLDRLLNDKRHVVFQKCVEDRLLERAKNVDDMETTTQETKLRRRRSLGCSSRSPLAVENRSSFSEKKSALKKRVAKRPDLCLTSARSDPFPQKTTREATQEATREATQEATQETTRESTREATRRSTREATREARREATREATKEATRESMQKARQEATRENTQKATRENTQKATREGTREATREASRAEGGGGGGGGGGEGSKQQAPGAGKAAAKPKRDAKAAVDGTKKARDGPSAKKAGDGPSAKKARDGPSAKKARDGPSAKKARDGPGTNKKVVEPTTKGTDGSGAKKVKQVSAGSSARDAVPKKMDDRTDEWERRRERAQALKAETEERGTASAVAVEQPERRRKPERVGLRSGDESTGKRAADGRTATRSSTGESSAERTAETGGGNAGSMQIPKEGDERGSFPPAAATKRKALKKDQRLQGIKPSSGKVSRAPEEMRKERLELLQEQQARKLTLVRRLVAAPGRLGRNAGPPEETTATSTTALPTENGHRDGVDTKTQLLHRKSSQPTLHHPLEHDRSGDAARKAKSLSANAVGKTHTATADAPRFTRGDFKPLPARNAYAEKESRLRTSRTTRLPRRRLFG